MSTRSQVALGNDDGCQAKPGWLKRSQAQLGNEGKKPTHHDDLIADPVRTLDDPNSLTIFRQPGQWPVYPSRLSINSI